VDGVWRHAQCEEFLSDLTVAIALHRSEDEHLDAADFLLDLVKIDAGGECIVPASVSKRPRLRPQQSSGA
jgi:hypothetical protein